MTASAMGRPYIGRRVRMRGVHPTRTMFARATIAGMRGCGAVAMLLVLGLGGQAVAETFGLMWSVTGLGRPVGTLGNLALVGRVGERVDAVDPVTGAVVRTFQKAASMGALGSGAFGLSVAAAGPELFVGAA